MTSEKVEQSQKNKELLRFFEFIALQEKNKYTA